MVEVTESSPSLAGAPRCHALKRPLPPSRTLQPCILSPNGTPSTPSKPILLVTSCGRRDVPIALCLTLLVLEPPHPVLPCCSPHRIPLCPHPSCPHLLCLLHPPPCVLAQFSLRVLPRKSTHLLFCTSPRLVSCASPPQPPTFPVHPRPARPLPPTAAPHTLHRPHFIPYLLGLQHFRCTLAQSFLLVLPSSP